LLVIGLVAMAGAMDEIHQPFLPRRFAELSDWIADVVGASLPLFILMASRHKGSHGADGNLRTKTSGDAG
jgi:VanZ family protein